MFKINFISTMPAQAITWAAAIYDEDISRADILPPVLIHALEKKKDDPVVETFVEDAHSLRRTLCARLGKKAAGSKTAREEAGALLFKKISEGLEETVVLDLRSVEAAGLDIVMGILLSSWRFHKYRTSFKTGESAALKELLILSEDPTALEQMFKEYGALAEGVLYARALTSEPPNIFYPEAYAESLHELKPLGIEIEILNEEKLHEIGMTALLAVGQGSMHRSSVVILKWNGAEKTADPVVIVGKGVCFDSGGLCLKPTAQQYEMKWDKAGAGVVAGLLKSLAASKAPVHAIGIIGLVENMPDGAAVKPGDIIKTMSGQTIEIVNTDAEGRLVLADCLWYAQERFHPKMLIDLGTLTGETFGALGHAYAGLYSNSKQLAEALKTAGETSGDKVWELPMGPFFAKQIESSIADMKNLGVEFCGENGAAAEFLKRFVKDIPWAHLDIAGVSWTKEDLPLAHQGVTGFGVRLLYDWLKNL